MPSLLDITPSMETTTFDVTPTVLDEVTPKAASAAIDEVTPRTVGTPTVLDDLPNELFPVIVNGDVTVNRVLALACKRFFAALPPISYSMRLDYKISIGHTVKITKEYIEWQVNGIAHRVDGPAVEYADGSKEWRVNGKLHRRGGPAVEWANGSKEWYVDGKLHRGGGLPAVERANGKNDWYVEGFQINPPYLGLGA